MLRIDWGGRSVGLVMGMRSRGRLIWWECCRMMRLAQSPHCCEVEMGGTVPVEVIDSTHFQKYPGHRSPYLHYHSWLNGHIYARLHANGVCEIYARHVNSKFADDGLDLKDCVPVVGFQVDAPAETLESMTGAWDGRRRDFEAGGVQFDLSEPARLATPDQPGSIEAAGGMIVWQPYLGMELYGGAAASDRIGDPYIYHAADRTVPRGMSRVLRFSLSLNPHRPPRVARYLAPAWWYGACEEFSPAPLLPVSNRFDGAIGNARTWLQTYTRSGGFEDGAIPRAATGPAAPGSRHEPGWEGETPGAAFLLAYRTGDAADYELALRACDLYTDVYVDHAVKLVRMVGYPPPAMALPHNRVHACVYAWLETGDAFDLDAARAVIENAHWVHRNSWPRQAVGRDAAYVRGAILLHRFLGDDHFHQIARGGIADIVASQRDNGSFGDQGGGAAVHGWAAFITKPWMGLIAVGPLIDYLEMYPDEDGALACIRRFADWMMRERVDHGGFKGWCYQHDYDGRREFFDYGTGKVYTLPAKAQWHVDYLARFLMFCTLRLGDPAYFDAYVESYDGRGESRTWDHDAAETIQFVPWLQARLWNARLTEDGLLVQPLNLGPRTPRAGTVMTPGGRLELSWSSQGEVVVPAGVDVQVRPADLSVTS